MNLGRASPFPTVGDALLRNARRVPTATAFTFGGVDCTYEQLYMRASRVARALSSQFGVQAGDRVAIVSLNRPEFLETYYACSLIGAVLTLVPDRLAPPEIERLFALTSPRAAIVDAELIDGIPATAQNVLIVGSLPETAADHPRLSWTPYEHSVSNAVDGALQPSKSIQPDDPLVIAFTSGTTGKPKGAMLSHRNILFDAASQDYQLRLRHDDRGIVAAPMCWTGGLMLITQPFLLRGLPITIIRKWNPSEVVEAIAADGCTVFGGVPTLLGQLVKHLQASPKVGLHIRAILCGGGNHTRGFDASVMQTLQPELYVFCYGMTESTGPLLYTGETEITLEKELALGYPAWHVEHQLRNGDGSEVERGEPGELVVRGPTISQGYFGQGSEGDSPFADGWFRTGDILRTGADGCLYFVDRAKDMIKSGGINVFAAEVEQAILAAFRDVVDDVAVVAAPSTTWGEAVVAFVKPRAGGQVDTALVASALRGMIAPYKIPKQVFTVEDVPRNFSGKIDKMELRSRLTQVDIG